MASRDPLRPNVVVLMSDDQGPWAMGCAGNTEIVTPNLDRLAAEGTRLDRFFCVSPVCSPARASMLTGAIPSAHGIHDAIHAGDFGAGPIDYLAGRSAYTDVLAAAGYDCALSGKWHLGASEVPQASITGWNAWCGGHPYLDPVMMVDGAPRTMTGYSSDVFADVALDIVDASAADDADRPFCLQLCFNAPHTPLVGCHPQEWLDVYADCAFATCPPEPPHPWTRPRDQNWEPYNDAFDDPRPSLIGYFAAISAMDAAIGRVLDRLATLDLERSTLVVFVSDNGFHAGHRGIWGKGNGTLPQNMFEYSVRVPAVVRQPGRVAAGVVSDALVSGYDLRPTLLDWVGLADDHSVSLPGRTVAHVLRGEPDPNDHVVVFDEYGPTRMIRSHEWKYVHRHAGGPHELYDLGSDPEERTNLVDDPARASVVRDLRATMHDWFARHADPDADGRDPAITGRGQIDLVGPRGGGRPAFLPERW